MKINIPPATAAMAFLLSAACSEAPPAAKAPKRPPEPLTGRQAFQQTYPAARTWAGDCQPSRVRGINLKNPESQDGKTGAWEITYVSEAKGRSLTYTWSAIEGEGLHEGVFAGHEEPWMGPRSQDRPFPAAAIRIDTPEALRTAIEVSQDYLKRPGVKPRINFLLELTPRFPQPVWRVFWGETVSAAESSVFIDATTGQFLGE